MKQTYFKTKEWNAICDVCGFEFKSSQLAKRWDGLYVCRDDYELRHPQDFLRVPKENTANPWSRPEQADVFLSDNIIQEDGINLILQEDGFYFLVE